MAVFVYNVRGFVAFCDTFMTGVQILKRFLFFHMQRRISRDGLLASSHRSVVPKPAVGAMGHLPEELSAVLTLKRGVHLQAALSRSGRSHNSNTTNTTMAATTTTTTTQHHPEQQRTPLLKRKRESIV